MPGLVVWGGNFELHIGITYCLFSKIIYSLSYDMISLYKTILEELNFCVTYISLP